MTEHEMERVLSAFPTFVWAGTTDSDVLFGGFNNGDGYEFRKGKFINLDDEDRNIRISNITAEQFLNYIKQEAEEYEAICFDNKSQILCCKL